MDEIIAYRQELLAALEGVISDLTELVRRTPLKKWHHKDQTERHTAHQILVHLWALEASEFALYFRRIIDEETPRLASFDDKSWMRNQYKPKEKPSVILKEISVLRKLELDWLRQLPLASWSRTARHPQWGVHTLQWWVELQLENSRQHLHDMSRLLEL
jgi:DinB superfamily